MVIDEMDAGRYFHDAFGRYIAHYGTPRHSGRYPWGSGENPYQRNAAFRSHVLEMRHQGLSMAEIARGMGMTRNELEAMMSKAKAENRAEDVAMAKRLVEKGYSKSAVARRMGINESQVRNLLKTDTAIKQDKAAEIADILKESLEKDGGYIDVGLGVEQSLGVSQYVLKNALAQLKMEGYPTYNVKVEQIGTGKETTVRVVCPPGTTYKDPKYNKGDIRLLNVVDNDTGRSRLGLERPVSVDPKRVAIRYKDDVDSSGGRGIDKDGVIELRRGVDDISLGAANYAQVRINVGDTHFLKGMAVYSDDMPDGVDIIFNTNKSKDVPVFGKKDNSILKELKKNKETGEIDWDNPFGATIKSEEKLKMGQRYYIDKNGEKKLSAVNIVNEEGDWEKWAPTLSSQFLSKQAPAMAEKQLRIVYDSKKAQYDEIMSLTNPTVKKKLLDELADECDSAAVHLKAAALPRQSSHVILPVPGLSETEIFAPNYNNGEKVALVRHPHAGPFEMPILTVNNKSEAGQKVVGLNAPDAVGINSKVAGILSGADFDGDTVLVIPVKNTLVQNKAPLKGLEGFEPKDAYRAYPGMPEVGPDTGFHKQRQMGDISNLITDMTLKGASDDKLVRAVRHSMVVIDAEKHNLDWRRSARENGIAELKTEYQGGPRSGASTLISQAKSEYRTLERKEISPDKRTGERRFVETGRTYSKKHVDDDGNVTYTYEPRMTKSTKMFEAKDAYELSSGTKMEGVYADHANRLKSLANTARKESLTTDSIPYSPSARKTYSKEVSELNAALDKVKANKPLERQAQIIAGVTVKEKIQANPDIKEDKDYIKKISQQALKEARARTGADKTDIFITDSQWEAIQAGAIHKTKLESILTSADSDRVKELALPRTTVEISPSIKARIRSLSNNGATQAEIAEQIGLSTTTINNILRENG